MNSPVALPCGYLGILKLAINPSPRGRIIGDSWACKGPVLLDLSERYDLNSGCSVEPTLLLHLTVVLATETRPHNNSTTLDEKYEAERKMVCNLHLIQNPALRKKRWICFV